MNNDLNALQTRYLLPLTTGFARPDAGTARDYRAFARRMRALVPRMAAVPTPEAYRERMDDIVGFMRSIARDLDKISRTAAAADDPGFRNGVENALGHTNGLGKVRSALLEDAAGQARG